MTSISYSKAYSARGAAMGRPSDKPDEFDTTSPLALERVPACDGGDYDPGGAYWGDLRGNPLWVVEDRHGARFYLRAKDLEAAKVEIKREFRKAGLSPRFAESDAYLSAFLSSYVECALWSTNDESTPGGGEPMDANYGPDDLAPETMEKMRAECADFLAQATPLLGEWSADQAGHDFWLTRNGHGAGFWDRGLKNGRALSDLCKPFGSVDLYVGDNGQIYQG